MRPPEWIRHNLLAAGRPGTGELGLDGAGRKVRGVLAIAMLAREHKVRGVLVPAACGAEACVVDGIEVYGVEHLSEVIEGLAGRRPLRAACAR